MQNAVHYFDGSFEAERIFLIGEGMRGRGRKEQKALYVFVFHGAANIFIVVSSVFRCFYMCTYVKPYCKL